MIGIGIYAIIGILSGYIIFRIVKRYNDNKTVNMMLEITLLPHSDPVQYSEELMPMLLYIDKRNPYEKVLMIKQSPRTLGIPYLDLIPIRFNTKEGILNDDQVYQVPGVRYAGKSGIHLPMNLGEWPKSTGTLFLKKLHRFEKQVYWSTSKKHSWIRKVFHSVEIIECEGQHLSSESRARFCHNNQQFEISFTNQGVASF